MKRGVSAKKTGKPAKMAMNKVRAKSLKTAKDMVKGMPADLEVCEKPHDMEHYRLSDDDDACFDSTR